MAITLRGTKNSALTHAELDGNFTDLDGRLTTLGATNLTNHTENINVLSLTVSSTNTTDIDVTDRILINTSTESGPEARLQSEGAQYDSHRFVRTGQSGTGSKNSVLFVTEYTDQGHTVGQGAGYWTRIKTTDTESHAGAILSEFESVTDVDNYDTRVALKPVRRASGNDSIAPVITASQTKIVFENTDQINCEAPLKIANLTQTEIGNLSASVGAIVFNTSTTPPKFQGWNGISWVDLG